MYLDMFNYLYSQHNIYLLSLGYMFRWHKQDFQAQNFKHYELRNASSNVLPTIFRPITSILYYKYSAA
jgi:hypothetical protein